MARIELSDLTEDHIRRVQVELVTDPDLYRLQMSSDPYRCIIAVTTAALRAAQKDPSMIDPSQPSAEVGESLDRFFDGLGEAGSSSD